MAGMRLHLEMIVSDSVGLQPVDHSSGKE
jgi:hypothetical protein